ncbi:arginase [Lipingzhangella halophila]|uniref:Arginase n=1 Tax=Lipingzhangella halophila TaxID=1783352 RepID=A0A7W7RIV7_9ACTN|nr:arginase family protein [Lipingzhangella halophila]MBB4932231.1 arginase [Lipingzhangella halophila]
MTTIRVPYHLDEPLPEATLPDLPGASTVSPDLPDGDLWARMAHLHEEVAVRVAESVRAAEAPAVLSGDCMVALGTIAGVQRAGVDASVVWFDAHGDLQTLETSASGYMGGIPLRILVGYRPELSAERLGLRAVAEERVLLVDGRDLDPPEAEFLAASPLRRYGVEEVAAEILPPGPIVLHVDLDVVDPGEFEGLLFPTPGGPGVSAVLDAARRVLHTGRVAALSIGCTWDPDRSDPAARSGLVADLVSHRASTG